MSEMPKGYRNPLILPLNYTEISRRILGFTIKKVPEVEVGKNIQSFHDNAKIAVAIYLKENMLIPRISTIEDVLRLREDPHIRHFRNKIFSWATKLQNGELGSEEAIRGEIQEANEAIRKLGPYRTISAWTTYISIGLDIFSQFIGGLPITLLTTTPLGLFLDGWTMRKEWQYRWLLLGR